MTAHVAGDAGGGTGGVGAVDVTSGATNGLDDPAVEADAEGGAATDADDGAEAELEADSLGAGVTPSANASDESGIAIPIAAMASNERRMRRMLAQRNGSRKSIPVNRAVPKAESTL